MKTIGRNDPCPCGSGKKFKKCCLGKGDPNTFDTGAARASDSLRQALAGEEFDTTEELEAFVEQHTQQLNQRSLDEFLGLSPEQMYQMLNFPFDSPELVSFPDVLDSNPTAPILTLFSLLADAIGERGLKPTATGNLPRNFCREAALAYWGEDAYRENTRVGSINREDDFEELHTVRVVAELAGLVRKYKGRFILSRDCRALLAADGLAAVYPRLFRCYVQQFNWGYRDGHPELRFIQAAFAFTLYSLGCYGNAWQPEERYEDAFLRAFPAVLQEVPPSSVFSPEEQVRSCYTWRSLIHFAGYLGLAEVEPVGEERVVRQYRVKATPLLAQIARFHPAR